MQDEAFELWQSEWGSLYEKDSKSRKVIDQVASSYYLVSVVDNNFVDGKLFDAFGV